MANGIANLHNASHGRTPLVSVVGDHATAHAAGAPLESDIEGLARPCSKWVRTSRSAGALARDARGGVAAATSAPGGVATLIVPRTARGATRRGRARRSRPTAAPAVTTTPSSRRAPAALRPSGR